MPYRDVGETDHTSPTKRLRVVKRVVFDSESLATTDLHGIMRHNVDDFTSGGFFFPLLEEATPRRKEMATTYYPSTLASSS